jgi:thymidylate synthase ThyX
MERTTENSLNTYQLLLDHQVAPEEARTILTLNTMTTVVWTGSLLFWARVRNQRVDAHAQLAAQELGRKLDEIVGSRYPVSWAALTA